MSCSDVAAAVAASVMALEPLQLIGGVRIGEGVGVGELDQPGRMERSPAVDLALTLVGEADQAFHDRGAHHAEHRLRLQHAAFAGGGDGDLGALVGERRGQPLDQVVGKERVSQGTTTR